MLTIVCGPMYSGKTTYILEKTAELTSKNKKFLVINHSLDTRYKTNSVVNHNNESIPATSVNMLNEILKPDFEHNISYYEHIFIDEAQFFTDLETSVLKIRKTHPYIDITCVGLDGDYQQNAFNDGQLLRLIPKSDNFIKLYSKCYKCNKRAPFTKRTINDSNQIIIGSVGVYVASCSKHL